MPYPHRFEKQPVGFGGARSGAVWAGLQTDVPRQLAPHRKEEQQGNGRAEQVGGGAGSRQTGQPQQMVEPVQGRHQHHALTQSGEQGGTAGVAGGLQEVDAQIVKPQQWTACQQPGKKPEGQRDSFRIG